jgi:hypothetical protein
MHTKSLDGIDEREMLYANVGVDRWILLKLILSKYSMRLWNV